MMKKEKKCVFCDLIYDVWATHYLLICPAISNHRLFLLQFLSQETDILSNLQITARILDDQHKKDYKQLAPILKKFPPFRQ